MAASHPKVGKALFEMGVTSSCEFEKHQYFTTHLHIAPEDELIYLGGLPPVSTRPLTTVCAHDCLCTRLFVRLHTTVSACTPLSLRLCERHDCSAGTRLLLLGLLSSKPLLWLLQMPDHDHMHNPDELLPECHKVGGCCLAAGPWDASRQVSTVTAAACNATDLTQKWSTVGGGQLCLMHANLCLHLAADNSVVLTPFAGVDTHEEQQWEVSAKSVIYRGDDRSGEICLEAKH